MLRPGGVARPALARAFTTKLSWAGSPRSPTLVMTEWLIVTYHCRTFTGWTGSLMGCEQRRKEAKTRQKPVGTLSTAAPYCFPRSLLPKKGNLGRGGTRPYRICLWLRRRPQGGLTLQNRPG